MLLTFFHNSLCSQKYDLIRLTLERITGVKTTRKMVLRCISQSTVAYLPGFP